MLLQGKQVAVVGGGPGGLTLARLLQLKGVRVNVYERDVTKEARVQGSPLDMHEESGWAALRQAGLLSGFNQHIRHGADKKVVVNAQAEVLFSDHGPAPAADAAPEAARPEIDRGALRQLLLESLQPGTVVWNSQFMAMESQDAGWRLHFKNGPTAYADLVIGADSANSKIRPYLTPIQAFYSGITMLEINVPDAANTAPHLYALLNGGKIMAFGDSKCLLGGQKGTGDLGFYASFKTPADWATASGLDYTNKTQLLAWFKQEYAGWSRQWDELFANATPPFIPRPIYCMPLNQDWEAQPNLTILGDAAHVMPPFAGEGANTSMRDALDLSECLTADRYATLREAIAAYETAMRQRAAQAAQTSLENGERMHSPGALEKMLAIFGKKPVPEDKATSWS